MREDLYTHPEFPHPEAFPTDDTPPAAPPPPPAPAAPPAEQPEGPPRDREMPLTEHIRELRNRIIVVIAAFTAAVVAALPFSGELARLVVDTVVPQGIQLTAYEPMEWLRVRITISVLCALAVGLPLLIYEVFAFMAPGLYPKESRYVKLVVPFSLALFLAGVSIAYFFTVPIFVSILLSYSQGFAAAQLSVGMVFGMVITVMLGFGVVFQLPIVILGAVRLGLIEYATLRTLRIVVYGLLFAVSIFLSPDPTFISQLIVTLVLIAMYELSLFFVRVLGWGGAKRKNKKATTGLSVL